MASSLSERVKLKKFATAHYCSIYNPPRKAFDFYAASALTRFMRSKDMFALPRLRLFFSGEYGLALVSREDAWESSLESYVSSIDTRVDPGDPEFVRTKKEYFQREISIMRTIDTLPSIEVRVFARIEGLFFSVSNLWSIVNSTFVDANFVFYSDNLKLR